ncbi:hypothetical protein G9A89_002209 [Geosiphon pyriformis]|nr:hypothetical protein G9A89_002209 [Geosiphon pyriformis]
MKQFELKNSKNLLLPIIINNDNNDNQIEELNEFIEYEIQGASSEYNQKCDNERLLKYAVEIERVRKKASEKNHFLDDHKDNHGVKSILGDWEGLFVEEPDELEESDDDQEETTIYQSSDAYYFSDDSDFGNNEELRW